MWASEKEKISSLVVYRLVHAPVNSTDARKRGSTPRQGASFFFLFCDSISCLDSPHSVGRKPTADVFTPF